MDDDEVFLGLRPDLFGLAYRMLGTVADAEDVVQEAYLRWHSADRSELHSPRSYLATIVARLCIDSLTSARARRERYVGPWLPEPLLVDESDPARAAELADSLSLAFLTLLEELSPAERAAFLLHDVFSYGYDDLACALSRTPAACRQLVSRARRELAARRRRFDADADSAARLTRRFLAACAGGDLDGLIGMLADDVVVLTDGGGKARAALRPVAGRSKAARFLVGISTEGIGADTEMLPVLLNGQPGMVIRHAGVVTAAGVLDITDGLVSAVRVILNPDKLGAITRALSTVEAGATNSDPQSPQSPQSPRRAR